MDAKRVFVPNNGRVIDYVQSKKMAVNEKPIISIILPAYNAHNTIKKTLSSIAMQQNIDEIETIIVDDCSERTYDHIAELFSHMMRIRVVRMLKNGGPGAARQVGYDHSVGDYVMWMDADDTLISADTMLTLKNVMIEREMDCVYGNFLEQNEDGSLFPHEIVMVWVFGKLYRRSFLDKYKIRFNTSLSNEDTGFNCLVKGCTEKIWHIPKDVYIWQFKPNSITRIKGGMYGQDSGYKGYLDNMVWQILEMEKRFVNKNYILSEIVSIMCVLYHFHCENMVTCPMNTETSLNWIRGYYELVYKPNEKYISPEMFNQAFREIAANQNLASKGIIPTITIYDFMDLIKAEPMKKDISQEIRGSTPAGYVPPITDPDWPVEIHDYIDRVELDIVIDSDTNESRYGGMKKVLGIPLTDKDYNPEYTGISCDKKKESIDKDTITSNPDQEYSINSSEYDAENNKIKLTVNGKSDPLEIDVSGLVDTKKDENDSTSLFGRKYTE